MSLIITIEDLTAYKSNKSLVPAVAQQVVDAVNAWIETRTHRCFGEIKSTTERADWSRDLWLRRQDIVPGTLVIKAGYPGQPQYTIASDSYFVNPWGRTTMYWRGFGQGNQSFLYNDYLELTYSYGVTEVPDDLKLAALGIASSFYNYALNGGQDVVASSVGTYRLQYAGSVRGVSGTVDPAKSTPDANWQIIDSYRLQRL